MLNIPAFSLRIRFYYCVKVYPCSLCVELMLRKGVLVGTPCYCQVTSAMSDSVRPHRWQSKYHTAGGLKNRNLLCYCSGGWKSKIKTTGRPSCLWILGKLWTVLIASGSFLFCSRMFPIFLTASPCTYLSRSKF